MDPIGAASRLSVAAPAPASGWGQLPLLATIRWQIPTTACCLWAGCRHQGTEDAGPGELEGRAHASIQHTTSHR
ncbi:hypothetical protein BS78_05G259300 [Paspalum vaginatum]|nr:hypothetical protein BS78_05G259300 [Paspalum vaginatum]KAJ1276987.1 hypothetical protein BS78_05G259300 [Paspalum vaginatum]